MPTPAGQRPAAASDGSGGTGHGAAYVPEEVETIGLVRRAICAREQVAGYLEGQGVRLCPHALGWRGEDIYVLGLVLRQRREPVADGPDWEWLMDWRWIRLADLRIPVAQKGDWVTCPRAQRPNASAFLTRVYVEAE
jgi:hypothetical protein